MPCCQNGGKSKHVIGMLVAYPHQCQAIDLHTMMVVSPCLLEWKTHGTDSFSIANTHDDRHVTIQLLAHLPQHSDVSRHQSKVGTKQTTIHLCHLCRDSPHQMIRAMMAKLAFQ